MGGSRRPPPPKPPALPPVSFKAKDYSMDRPSEVQNELDDLRNRGIAKVLNRHFTDTTKQLAKEKAAADAALADLERRRAQTSQFVPSGGGELHPFDSMYVELQQKRAECRRKERETILLYQRYVHKYGGKNAVSTTKAGSGGSHLRTPPNAAALAAEELSPATSAASTPEAPPPPSPLPSRMPLQPLNEDIEAEEGEIDSAINFSKFYNKRIQDSLQSKTVGKDPPTNEQPMDSSMSEEKTSTELPEVELALQPRREPEECTNNNDPPEFVSETSPTPRKASDEDFQGEDGKDANNRTVLFLKLDPPADPPSVHFPATEEEEEGEPVVVEENSTPKVQNVQSAQKENKFAYGKALFPSEDDAEDAIEEDEVDAPTESMPSEEEVDRVDETADATTPAKEEVDKVDATADTTSPVKEEVDEGDETADTTTPAKEEVDKGDETADAMTPTKVEADKDAATPAKEEVDKVDETADTTTPAMEHMIKSTTDRMEIGSDTTSDSKRPTREVMTEIPAPTAAAAAMLTVAADDDDDDRSIISGLTMNSHMTRQVMEEIELEMTQFLSTETEAIRKMLDEEEERTQGSTVLNSSFSVVGDESRRASMKAEAMAKEMQKILDEYAKDDQSISPFDTEETDVDTETVATTSAYPRKYETSDPTKNWMVYYDESFQREYYFEMNSQTTQWDPPGSRKVAIEPRLFSDEVPTQNSMKRTTSRRSLYRKKLRKRRMRRAAAFAFVGMFVGGTVYHWQSNHRDKTYQEAIVAGWQSTSSAFVDVYDMSLYAVADAMESSMGYLKDQFEYAFTDRQQREDAEKEARLQEMEKESKTELEKLAAELERVRLEAEVKAAEETVNLQEQQKREEEVEAQRRQEEVRRLELEQQQAMEAQQRAEAEATEASTTRAENAKSKALQRPWGCYLPLSYIFPQCNRLLKTKPLYKDSDILNSFLQ